MKKNIKKILPYAVMGCAFLVLFVLNIFFHDHWLDSDMAAEMIFSKLLSEEGHLFATPDWYYSTEFRLVYTQLLMVPLFKVFQSFHVIRAVTNLITCVLMLASYFYMMNSFKVKRSLVCLTSAVLLLPFSETMMTHMQLGNTYMPHVIIVFVFFGIFLRLSDKNIAGKKRLLLFIMLLITGMICGVSGVRYLLAIQCPLVIASFIYLLKSEEFVIFREKFGKSELSLAFFKKVIKSDRAGAFYYSLSGLLSAVLGYGINIFAVSAGYVFQTYDSTNFISIYRGVLLERLQDAFGSLIMLFGYIPDRGVISLRGLVSVMAFVLLGIFIFITVRTIKKCEGLRYFATLFFVAAFSLNSFIFVFTTSTLVPRYYITVLVFILPLIAFYLEEEGIVFDRTVVLVLLASALLIGSAKTTFSFITVDKNEDKRKVAQFLVENRYDFGYATYWNANIITELTDAKVEVANILDPESLTYFTWSTPMKYYGDEWTADYSDKKVFMLLTREEASEYSDCKAVLSGEKVFDDDNYLVYAYENAGDFLECGEGNAGGFR